MDQTLMKDILIIIDYLNAKVGQKTVGNYRLGNCNNVGQ